MSAKKTVFLPGWRKFAAGAAVAWLAGCAPAPVSEPAYPEYDKWWEDRIVRHVTVTTNDVLEVTAGGGSVLHRGVVSTNVTEVMLL